MKNIDLCFWFLSLLNNVVLTDNVVLMRAWSHSSFQLDPLAPFRVVKNGFNWSVKWDINCPRAASRSVSF